MRRWMAGRGKRRGRRRRERIDEEVGGGIKEESGSRGYKEVEGGMGRRRRMGKSDEEVGGVGDKRE